ncbi:MAG: carboxypeptidase regulatory-like domain-containing protein, partial [Catalinimonas sp.]
MFQSLRRFSFLSALLGLMVALPAWSQGVTTASFTGRVLDENGEPLPGATVLAVHQPTGAQYGNATNLEGRFNLRNVRAGGPYRIEVSFVGYLTQQQEGLFLTLGETRSLAFQMQTDAVQLGEVAVIGYQDELINGNRTGISTGISEEAINTLPTASRNLNDFLRLTPQATVVETGDGPAISIAGQNNRFNSIYVDGAINNDVFGLSGSGTNGGQTGLSPFSIDAIEQMQVVISPYDVSLGNFTGGGINVTTRSGTNDFEGSAYYFLRNENLAGRTPLEEGSDSERERLSAFTAQTYGFRVGGPLIKDKLFFFVSGELQRDETPQPFDPNRYLGDAGLDANEVPNGDVLQSNIAQLRGFLQENYNYDPGNFLNNVRNQEADRMLVKLDWNISQNHKLTARHSYTRAQEIERNASTTGNINFENGPEIFPSNTNVTALDLQSNFGDRFANNLILGYTAVRDDRNFLGDPFPSVRIQDGANGSIAFGPERFSIGNVLNQDIFTITNNFNVFLGNHTLTFGTHNEFYSIYNLFLRENFGYYQYGSLEAFYNDAGPDNYDRTYVLRPGIDAQQGDDASAIAADFDAGQLGFYVQDEFQLSQNLRLTGGLRIDVPYFADQPTENDRFNQIAPLFERYHSLQGARSGNVPDPQLLFSPRFGFNADVFGDRSLQVRGGLGIFTGRVPFVWPGGMFTNNGVFLASVGVDDPQQVVNGDTIPLRFSGNPFDQYVASDVLTADGEPFETPPSQVDLFAEDFRYPQVFRSSLAVDYQLPFNLVASLEGIYTRDLNPIVYNNVNLRPPEAVVGQQPNGNVGGFDSRPVYGNFTGRRFSADVITNEFDRVILASNGRGGDSYFLTAQLQKTFSDNMFINAAYTFGRTRVIYDATSSQNSTNWRNALLLDRNDQTLGELGFSNFDLGSRITVAAAYRLDYLDFLATTFSVFYTGQSGERFSYTYNRAGSGYAISGNDGAGRDFNNLIYIPRNQGEINLIDIPERLNDQGELISAAVSAETQWQRLDEFIENDPYLSNNRGEYAVRNGARVPFQNVVDFKLIQDIYLEMPNGKR